MKQSLLISIVLGVWFAGCSNHNPFVPEDDYLCTTSSVPPVQEPITSKAMYRATMKPYCINGVTYYPIAARVGQKFYGIASWYGPNFHGGQTSNGEYYDMYALTAAHKTLPINTMVKVTNLQNGKSTIVRINDRGPFVPDRIIDLSYQAAQEIGLIKHGTAKVELEVVSLDKTANRYAHRPPAILSRPTAVSDAQKMGKTPTVAPFSEVAMPTPPAQATTGVPHTVTVSIPQTGGYAVQIASFSEKAKALAFKQRCYNVAAGHTVRIREKKIADKPIYTILIGTFRNRDDAKAYMKRYGYRDAFIVKD